MRFCQGHQLGRTRRILAEMQAEIEKTAKPKAKRVRNRKFEPWQLAAGDRWAASVEKKAG